MPAAKSNVHFDMPPQGRPVVVVVVVLLGAGTSYPMYSGRFANSPA
jgi:hypothetical protein